MKRLQTAKIGIALCALFISVGTLYGAFPNLKSSLAASEVKNWMSGVSFIWGQILCFPVLMTIFVAALYTCRFSPQTISIRHTLLLLPLVPTAVLIGLGGYCFANPPPMLPRHLESWQSLCLNLCGLLLLLSFVLIGKVFYLSECSDGDRNFATSVLVSELIIIIVSAMVSSCAISGVWP